MVWDKYVFKQKDHEIARDYVSPLKQYKNQCLDHEKPSQNKIVSIFLEGLKNTTLHDHLYAKKHESFNACCLDAMDYEDNFHRKGSSIDINSQDGKSQDKSMGVSSSSAKDLNQDQLVDLVLKQLGQTYRPYRPIGYIAHASQGPYSCGICAGPHKMEMCNSYMPGANNTQG